MTGRAFAIASALLCASGVYGAASCAITPTTPPPIGYAGPPLSFSIVSPLSNACVEVPDTPDAVIPVTITILGFTLRPPGQCAGLNNCGHLLLQVDGVDNNTSASPIVDVLLRKRVVPYGCLTLTAILVDDRGNPWLVTDNVDAGALADGGSVGPFKASITILTAPSCEGGGGTTCAGPGDGGTGDAGPGDAGDGG